jgi:hypothetical protein
MKGIAMSSLKGGATKLTSDLKSAAAGAAGAAGPKSEIEWTNYNYPPLILVMHFDLSELSDGGRKPVAWAHRSYLILLLGLLTNGCRTRHRGAVCTVHSDTPLRARSLTPGALGADPRAPPGPSPLVSQW